MSATRPGIDAWMLGSGPIRSTVGVSGWAKGSVVLPGPTESALVRALILGGRSGLGPEQWEVLTRTGTSHLIATPGCTWGMVAGFLFFLARWAWSRSARLVLVLAAPRAGALAALAGFAVST